MKISIIIPIYNAEKSVTKMLDSLKKQTLMDFEVIMIDDGSTDQSPTICDNYQFKDKRFKAIHKKNEGVSIARQIGIEHACGEYVIHADADDWVEPNMLESLYDEATKTNADIVFCDFFVNDSEKEFYRNQKPNSNVPINVLHALFQQLHGSCCNKLVKRACYSKYGCHFPKGIDYCEDLLFWVQLLQHKEIKIAYLNKAFYHYVMNTSSITHHITRKTYNTRYDFYKLLCQYLPQQGFEREKRNVRLNILVEGYMNGIVTNSEAWKLLWKKNLRNALLERKSIRWRIGYLCLACGLFSISKRLFRF